MKSNTARHIVLMTAFIFSISSSSLSVGQDKGNALDKVLHERSESAYTFPTKFGLLKFLRDDGVAGYPSTSVVLGSEVLVSSAGERNKQGGPVSLLPENMAISSSDVAPRRPGQAGHADVKRMVVLVAEDGNCTKQFLILDFTQKRPFVSSRFGYNPDDEYCLSFKKAKWGTEDSFIFLSGPMKYVYKRDGRVFGPVE